jgi:hypothetical protein
MYLIDIVEALEAADQTHVAPIGLGEPHSFRGYYEDLAFEPERNVSVAYMLANAKKAMGSTYSGWKGGEYVMGEYTECWISYEGTSHQATKIGSVLMDYILGKV